MSDPPPGAVLMMNSTGFVGAMAATPDAFALPAGALVAALPPLPPQAAATVSPTIASAMDLPSRFRIFRPSRCCAREARVRWSDHTTGQTGGIVALPDNGTQEEQKYARAMHQEAGWQNGPRMVKE